MSILTPTNLETADYGTTGWNAIYSTNFQLLNDYLAKFKQLWDNTAIDKNILIYDSNTGTWIAQSKFDITNNPNEGVSLITASLTLSTETIILADATTSAITITVPDTNTDSKRYTIKKIDNSTNTITIQIESVATIDGQTSITLANQYDVVNLVYYQGNYYII